MNDINNSNIKALESLAGTAARPVITAHMHPDGDAVGSCVALYHVLAQAGKIPSIVLPDKSPSYLSFLTDTVADGGLIIYEDTPAQAENAVNGSDLIFSLDYNAFHRTGKMEALLAEAKAAKVLIDHHLNPARELFGLSFSETQVSSTAEYLYHIFMAMSRFGGDTRKLPAASATALMTGMTSDTNNFANSVFPSTLRMASALLEAGTDRDGIISQLYQKGREERIRLQGEMLSRRLRITGYGVAYMILDKATIYRYNLQEGETEGFVNIPLSIEKVKLSCFFKEDQDRIRVSLRSKRGVSANKCAELYFHGGGHELAAGGRLMIPDDVASVKDVARYVERVTRQFMKKEQEK